jgi:glycosyltransferase involved in cell wall biosynthesis
MRLALTANDARSALLFEELRKQVDVVAEIDFDDIDFLTKYAAALLSFDRPRSEWWENYQMHPLIQRRRRKVLQKYLKLSGVRADALLMWGSWFHPTYGLERDAIPFFNYIDQSRSLNVLPGEPAAAILHRERSFQLQAETYQASRGIFCMSDWARQQTLDAHSISEQKVHAVGWGPCSVDLSAENERNTQPEKKILHVSNDFYRKGVDYLIAVAERVARVEPNVCFVVIGKDVSGMDVSGAGTCVEFLGPIKDIFQLKEHFRSASAFLLPHRFDRSPHVLVEAMSASLPIIASAQGGAIELIQGKDTGFLVPVGDIDGYVAAIITLMRDNNLRSRFGENGRKLVQEKYNWRTIAKKMLSIIALELTVLKHVY